MPWMVHLDDLVRGQEAIADALPERVDMNRLAEVVDVRDILGFPGGGGEADLRGALEVLQDLPPSGIFRRTAPVAFVNNDEVEKVGEGSR